MTKLKKLLIVLLTLTMVLLTLSACNSTSTKEQDSKGISNQTSDSENVVENETFVVGAMQLPIQDESVQELTRNQKFVVDKAGGSVFSVDFDGSTDGMITAVEELIAKDVDGFAFVPFDESALPVISQMCEEGETYFYILMRNVSDPEIKELLESNPYYLGCQYEDERQAGYEMVAGLAKEKGVKKIAYIGRPEGDNITYLRDQGIQAACEEFGVEIVAESRTIQQASDAAKSTESFIAAYPDLDAIIYAGTIVAGCQSAVLKVLEDNGKAGEILFAGWDWFDEMTEYLEKGYIYAVTGGHFGIESNVGTSVLVNQIKGTPLSDKKIELKIPLILIKSKEDFELYQKYCYGDGVIYNEEELKQNFFKFENPEVSLDSIQKIVSKWSIEDLRERREK